MNKIGPNIPHSTSADKNANHNVVTNITKERKLSSRESEAKFSNTAAPSTQAIDLSSLESKIYLLPEIDTAKVVDIHNRIMAGEYEIDADRLAGKLKDLESSL